MAEKIEQQEQKKNGSTHPTNEFDVKIAQIKADAETAQMELGAKLMMENQARNAKKDITTTIVGSVERVLVVGMIFGGVVYTTGKRYEMMSLVAGDNIE